MKQSAQPNFNLFCGHYVETSLFNFIKDFNIYELSYLGAYLVDNSRYTHYLGNLLEVVVWWTQWYASRGRFKWTSPLILYWIVGVAQ